MFILFLVMPSTCLWFLDRKQLPHGCGLHLHLFEGMFGVKELTVDFVRSNKAWLKKNKKKKNLFQKKVNAFFPCSQTAICYGH